MATSIHDTHSQPPIAARLARFACRLRLEHIPAAVRERALDLVLDAAGVALAANRYPFAQRVLDGASALAGTSADSRGCTLIGRTTTLPLRDAMLVNGALIHGLDYDDTHVESVVHATAASLPAALGVAEHAGAAGADLLAAYVAGVEVAVRLGLAKPFGFHAHGYHGTGVVAHFASALVAARLLGLDEQQAAQAQGITASTATASQEFAEEGAWTKRLHPGWGAVAGVTAAFMARAGFVAPSRPYEGRHGIYRMHLGEDADAVDLGAVTRELGERWRLLECAVKPFPACHFNHAVADAALALREAGVAAGSVRRLRILIPRETLEVIAEPLDAKRRPRSDYEAKFSAPFVAAAALVRGRFGLEELEDDALRDPEILALAARSECVADPDSAFPRYFSAGIEAFTQDGRHWRHHEAVNRGAGDRALSSAEVEAKFAQCAALWLDAPRAAAVRDAVRALPDTDARTFMSALKG